MTFKTDIIQFSLQTAINITAVKIHCSVAEMATVIC